MIAIYAKLKFGINLLQKAVKGKMKIMKEDWVADVWKLSKNDDDAYTTDEFYQSYKLPIFHKLVITSTGLTEAEKKEIVKLINDNGGTYSGSFKVSYLRLHSIRMTKNSILFHRAKSLTY